MLDTEPKHLVLRQTVSNLVGLAGTFGVQLEIFQSVCVLPALKNLDSVPFAVKASC